MATHGDQIAGLTLARFLAPLQAEEELRLSVGADAEGHEPVTALSSATLEAWMVAVGHSHADMDPKTRAAYLIGDIAWAFSLNLGAMHLAGAGLPDVSADRIGAAPQWYHWEEDGESGTALRFTLRLLAAADTEHRPLGVDGIRALVVAFHAPLIEQLFATTKLGRSALWRLVADAIAAGWLTVGKRIGQELWAMQAADAIIKQPGSPLYNKQTSFIEVVVRDEAQPEQVVACEWFRARGGCCRYYTTEAAAGDYCTTCVLRSTESRDDLLHAYLKGKTEAAA